MDPPAFYFVASEGLGSRSEFPAQNMPNRTAPTKTKAANTASTLILWARSKCLSPRSLSLSTKVGASLRRASRFCCAMRCKMRAFARRMTISLCSTEPACGRRGVKKVPAMVFNYHLRCGSNGAGSRRFSSRQSRAKHSTRCSHLHRDGQGAARIVEYALTNFLERTLSTSLAFSASCRAELPGISSPR